EPVSPAAPARPPPRSRRGDCGSAPPPRSPRSRRRPGTAPPGPAGSPGSARGSTAPVPGPSTRSRAARPGRGGSRYGRRRRPRWTVRRRARPPRGPPTAARRREGPPPRGRGPRPLRSGRSPGPRAAGSRGCAAGSPSGPHRRPGRAEVLAGLADTGGHGGLRLLAPGAGVVLLLVADLAVDLQHAGVVLQHPAGDRAREGVLGVGVDVHLHHAVV